MATNLLETYKQRLAISEQVYAKRHMNESMPSSKVLATAKCLDNITQFINEAFENSVGTQRSAMGEWKKFTLNLTTVAVPNLIAFDLVKVYPMSSITGYISYVKFTAGSNKGATKQGDVFNDPFRLGKVDVNYTAASVIEDFKTGAGDTAKTDFTMTWTPVANVAKVLVDGVEKTLTTDYTVEGNTVKFTTAPGANKDIKIAYTYDNVVIPQNDLPILNAEMAGIALTAKARRIAVYYSQIAAFQAKTDYGFDLAAQLAEKAVGQLNYEIDTEVTDLLINNADADADLVWSKTLPVGVNKADHYEGFMEIVEIARQKIYDRTKRYAPNYMLIASNILPILTFIKGFKAAPAGQVNGPYFAGTLDALKVYVTPNIEPGKFVIGVNSDDMEATAAVYAPYMPIVPTQLLGYADGGMSQGFSTMYDLKILNKDLLVAGRVTA